MASLNKVILIGRLGQDPELRYTATQQPVAQLSVATSDSYQKDGQKVETTEWHRVIVWGKQGENCGKYLAKGRSVCVEGKLQTRSWQDKDGQKRYSTEIVAHNVIFMDGGGNKEKEPVEFPTKHVEAAKPAAARESFESFQNFDDIPFAPSR